MFTPLIWLQEWNNERGSVFPVSTAAEKMNV